MGYTLEEMSRSGGVTEQAALLEVNAGAICRQAPATCQLVKTEGMQRAYNVGDEEEEDEGERRVAEERPLGDAVEAVVLQHTLVAIDLDVCVLVLVDHGRTPAIPQPIDVPKPAARHPAVSLGCEKCSLRIIRSAAAGPCACRLITEAGILCS